MRIQLLILCVCLAQSGFAQYDAWMIHHGMSLLGTPYVAHTLEQTPDERLVTDRSQLDCTTFVEVVMAMTLSTGTDGSIDEERFADNLTKIRYRGGVIDGYTSRLHYMSDWVNDNVRKEVVEEVTPTHNCNKEVLSINFMSAHPQSYTHLNNNPAQIAAIEAIEESLTGTTVYTWPKEKLPSTGMPWIRNGDIVLITTRIKGLDVSHVGIALYRGENLHLLHASTTAKQVIVSSETLSRYLAGVKHVTGIRVVRLKE